MEETGALRLRKGSLRVELVLVEDAPETDEVALAKILGKERMADRVIVASLGRFTEEARLLALKSKVQLWDRAHLEEEVGRMVMGEVDSRPAAAADDSILEPFLAGGPGELFFNSGDGGAYPAQTSESGVNRATSASGGPSEDQSLPAGMEIPDGEAMLRPSISQEQVRSIVADRMEGAFRFDMQLLPHYVLSYRLEMDGPGGSKMKRTGMVLVNAITGEASELRPGMTPEKLEPGGMRIEPSLERSAATGKALELVMNLHTRVVNLKQEKRSVTVYEKRTIRPKEDAVILEYKGMLYLPVWCVEGADGAEVLDALTGRVIKHEPFDTRSAASDKGPES